MPSTSSDRPRPSYKELVELVRDLPTKQQHMLADELRRLGLKAKWEEILAAFEPNSVSEREIVRTSKAVRRELWEKRRNGAASDRR